MGHHYVPRAYLRRFASDDERKRIWQYDRQSGTCREVPIKDVAQKPGFYAPTIEKYLGDHIETPGNRVMQKLLRQEFISHDEANDFATYLGAMLLRIPARRIEAYQLMPHVAEETRRSIAAKYRAAKKAEAVSEIEIEEQLKIQLDPLVNKLISEPPEQVHERIRNPIPSPLIIAAIRAMNWMIIKAPPSRLFFTSDNPAYFPTIFALDTEHSELVFPLSPRFAFHGSLEARRGKLGFINATHPLIIEINRRIAQNSTRFAFSNTKADWIVRLMKRSHSLRPIRFGW